jgi:hypothetical protein
MKHSGNSQNAWAKLAQRTQAEPQSDDAMPFGFSTRVVAAWNARPQEATWAMMEWFTWRALALAMIIAIGSAAISYDGLSTVLANETSQASAFIDDLINL